MHGTLALSREANLLIQVISLPQPCNAEKDHNSGDSFSATETL